MNYHRDLFGFDDTPPRRQPSAKDARAAERAQRETAKAITARDVAMALVEENAGPSFGEQAKEFVLSYLRSHGPTAGEDVTDACKGAGIVPHDDRAFGPVYYHLARRGLIEKQGTCKRRKGHATTGGNVWSLAAQQLKERAEPRLEVARPD